MSTLGPDEIDLFESRRAIDIAAQAAQHAYNNAQAQAQTSGSISSGMMGGYPTKSMQNAAPTAAPGLEEEQARAKRIDEMTFSDYQRAIRRMKVYTGAGF